MRMNGNIKQALELLKEVVDRDDNFWRNNMEDLVKVYQLLGDKGWDDFNQL
jgi:lipopolysaccharide biosynthesis regulator YciM